MNDIAKFDARQFRQTLGMFTTGVTIVTTRGADGEDCGLTANSFNSVSVDPPMVLWSLNKNASSLPAFIGSDHFAVHILASDQESISNRFAKSGAGKFEGLNVERGVGRVPLLEGCSARFQCRTVYRYEGGDHLIIVGEVLALDLFGKPPLVFHAGGYKRLLQPVGGNQIDENFGGNWLGSLLGRAYFQLQLPIREQLKSMGMRNVDFDILAGLSFGEGRTLHELNEVLEFVDKKVRQEDLEPWVAKGLLVMQPGNGEADRLYFSEAGRRLSIQWLAFAKGAEMTALQGLDYEEGQQLKLLLQKIIQHTGTDLPEHWRRENVWRENNIWRQAVEN